MSKIEVKKIELVWKGKYDEDGRLRPTEKPGPYPFQIVEVINAPRTGRKEPEQLTLFNYYKAEEGETFEEGWKNKLIWGDNKLVMSSLLEKFAGRINLIYIDPPFATGADFKFKIQVGEEGEQIVKEHSIIEEKAYRDTWGKGVDSYLEMMWERLWLMKELLAENGSIYVHLDWHVGHYVKVMMDEIFGVENFRNEIVWSYRTGGASLRNWSQKHDTILFYSKTEKYIFNTQKEKAYTKSKSRKAGIIDYGGGKAEFFEDEYGVYNWVIARDVWDIPYINSQAYERLAFDTQKPEALLKRIILASSNPGDIVADFFCGSGTTLAVAEKLGRRWIGCDLSRFAIHITRKRLLEIEKSKDLLNEGKKYKKKAKPFEILNLGKYERQFWQVKTFNKIDEKQALYEYLAFILKLYRAEPISGFTHIHGKKGNALIYVGPLDSPVTIQEVVDAMSDCKAQGHKELHVLGWEWEMGLNDAIQEIAKREKIKLKLRIIPNEVLDKQAVGKGDIRFFELAYFKVDIRSSGKKVTVELKDFVIPHTDRRLSLKADHVYEQPGKYKIFVKVIDIFGVDTSQVYEVEVK